MIMAILGVYGNRLRFGSLSLGNRESRAALHAFGRVSGIIRAAGRAKAGLGRTGLVFTQHLIPPPSFPIRQIAAALGTRFGVSGVARAAKIAVNIRAFFRLGYFRLITDYFFLRRLLKLYIFRLRSAAT